MEVFAERVELNGVDVDVTKVCPYCGTTTEMDAESITALDASTVKTSDDGGDNA